MNPRNTLPLRPLAAFAGVVGLALLAGLSQAQQPAKPAAKSAAAKPSAAPVKSTAAAPASAVKPAPAPAAAAPAPAPAAAPVREESTSQLIQGELIYRHLGDPDPFWPKPNEHDKCKNGAPGCIPVDAKGCMKYKLEEMVLTGVTDTSGLKVAMLSAENKPYFVKTGDHCQDATVLDIDIKTTCVKWRQTIPQSENNIRPYKDVTSCLKAQSNQLTGSKG